MAARAGPRDAVAERVRRLSARAERWFPVRCLRRYLDIRGTDRALIVAGQSFTALIPLIIVTATVLSPAGGTSLAQRMNERFHLTGAAAQAVTTMFERPPGAESAVTIGSVILLLASGLSLSRSLQRTYEAAWQLPPRGVKGTMNGLAALGLLLSQVLLLSLVAGMLREIPAGSVVTPVLRAGLAVGLWLVLQYVLLGSRVPWRELLPGALVAGIGQQVVTLLSALWMPTLIANNTGRYGVIGVAFSLLSWLLIIAVVLVVAAVVSAELGRAKSTVAQEVTPAG